MKAYNASPSTCKEYWGHFGREWTTWYRTTPTVFLLFFLGVASFQLAKGSICIFNYPFNLDKVGKLPSVTLPDYERVNRMQTLKFVFVLNAALFSLLIAVYAFCSIISVLTVWASSRRAIKRTGTPIVT
jgi:hypothetical protein